MRIRAISIPVKDQEAALAFYTSKLNFIKKLDIPVGDGNRWLTLVPEEEQDGPELLLEPSPNHLEEAKIYQEALYAKGIPWTQFEVKDLEAEYKQLLEVGVVFSMAPTDVGTAKIAVFDDTCGNRIQLMQVL